MRRDGGTDIFSSCATLEKCVGHLLESARHAQRCLALASGEGSEPTLPPLWVAVAVPV